MDLPRREPGDFSFPANYTICYPIPSYSDSFLSLGLEQKFDSMPDFSGKYTGTELEEAVARANRLVGANSVTTLASLPVTKRTINATLSEQTTLSVSSGMEVGDELIIRCVPSASWTQPIPNSGDYTSMSGASIEVTSGVPFEISVWCYAAGSYSIMAKAAE